MIKVLYVVSTLKRSGPIIVLSNIIKYLNKGKFEPIVLTLSPEPVDSMKEYFENKLKVKVFTLGLSRIKSFFVAKKCIEKFIKENDVSIIHSHGFRADMFVSKLYNIKSVSTLHNYPYYDYTMLYGKFLGTIIANLHLKFLKKISYPVACSESVSKMLKNLNNYEIRFVRNGMDINSVNIGFNKKYLRNKLGIKEDVKVFIFVGGLHRRKDPFTLINAFKKAKIENSMLFLVGDGKLKKECIRLLKGSSNIKLTGKVNNVYKYLEVSDYFISASLAEGLPNAVLEAMGCGLPCILSEIPPHVEISSIDKNSSLLFKPKDVNELSQKLKEILKLEYEKMSKAAKNIIFNHLNAEIMSKKYQEIYDKLVNGEKI